mmetsp:Transcript_54876/g.112026  ORF Transcript_54876/g.112026 Transcript_54876/m.112026 type:complete len:348 (+) Transcript_54876:299-1342(+)
MPGANRSVKDDVKVKAEPGGPEISLEKLKEVSDFDVDLAKMQDESDEASIFSACNSPDDVEDSTASELGEYELSYLHNIYHSSEMLTGHDEDAILPDAIAPPSLGAISGHLQIPAGGVHLPTPPQSSSKKPAIAITPVSEGRNAPPRGSQDTAWESDNEVPSRSSSPIPSGPALKASCAKSTISRKRKAVSPHPIKVEPSPKQPRMKGPAESKVKGPADDESKVDLDDEDDSSHGYGSDGDRGISPCPSNTPMLDGLEIRPEDDPLGLFSKDPSTLTPEEQRILKKQRRLLKNRESAQLSRHRKKMHLNSLERQGEALKKEKSALATRVQDLSEENERLRKQLVTLP